MKLLTVDTIEQALEKLKNCFDCLPNKTETISLEKAVGRILAQDIFSPCDIPSWRRSTVDGYAVLALDTSAAGESIPVNLKMIGSVSMGERADLSIRSGECVYVPTGAMLPDGADAVVMVEYCEQADEIIAVYEAASSGSGIIDAGEDFQNEKLLLRRGSCIRAQEIGALCAAGITSVTVDVPLTLSVFSTGDELVPPQCEPAIGKVRDVNTSTLKALAAMYGYSVVVAAVLGDDEEKIKTAVNEAKARSDIILISGGSSKGEKDFTAQVIDSLATPGVFTNGLAVKPGKPTILGWDEQSKTIFAGLPGHPVSAMMIFSLLFASGQGKETDKRFPIPARLTCNVPGSPGLTRLLPVILSLKNGYYCVEPVFGKAAMISTLTRADGYTIIDLNKEGLQKGEEVLVHLF